MKKVLAVVLSLCMLFGCVGFAKNGGKIHTTVTWQGQTLADLLAEFGYDTDGCEQLSLSGQVQQQMLDLFLQIGEDSLVIGSGEELYEITSGALGQAMANILTEYIGEEKIAMIGTAIAYFTEGGFKADMPVLSYALQNEIMRLMSIAQQDGIVTVAEDGTVTIEADEVALKALIGDYLAALAADDAVFARLSATQLWSLLKLSEGGAQEKMIVSQLAAMVAQANIDAKFYILAVITPAGSFDLTLTLAREGVADLAVSAAFADGVFALDLAETVSATSLSAVIDTNNSSFTYEAVTDMVQISAEYQFGEDGSIAAYVDELVNVNGIWVKAEFQEEASLAKKSLSYSAVIDYGPAKDSLQRAATIDVSFDMVNGLAGTVYVAPIDTTFTCAAYAEQNGFNAYLDMSVAGQPAEDLFRLNVKMGAAIEVYAMAKKINTMTGEINDFLELSASVNLATAAVDAVLALDGTVYVLTGELDENNVYTATVQMNGMTLGTAALAMDPSQGLAYSLLMGDFSLKLFNGMEITRTSELTDDALTMTINVTSGEQTQTITAGLRPIREENEIVGYELFLGNGPMEYKLGFTYHTYHWNSDSFSAEAYLKMVYGPQEMEMGRVTFDYEAVNVPGAHVTGVELTAEQIEQFIGNAIDSLTATQQPTVYDYGFGA